MTSPKPLPPLPTARTGKLLPQPPGQQARPNKPLPVPPPKALPVPPRPLPPPPGGLRHAMHLCHDAGDPVGVLLIDEGDGHAQHPETDAQRKVLETARLLGLKVILVEIDTTLLGGDRGNLVPTRREFRPYGQHVVRKPRFNAFDDDAQPSLQATLDTCGLNPGTCKLVVMGFNTNQCVRLTAVGGREKPGGTGRLHEGATQRGYHVMTCQDVLRGGAAAWRDALRVQCFPHV